MVGFAFVSSVAVWSFNASTALVCSSSGSGCAGWGWSQEEPFGAPHGAEPET